MTSRLRRNVSMRTAKTRATAATSTASSNNQTTGRRTSGRAHRVLQGSYLEETTDEESDDSDEEQDAQDAQDAQQENDDDDDGASDESEEQYSPLRHTPKRPRAANNGSLLAGRKRTHHQAAAIETSDDDEADEADEAYLSPASEVSPRKRRNVVAAPTPPRRRTPPKRTTPPKKKSTTTTTTTTTAASRKTSSHKSSPSKKPSSSSSLQKEPSLRPQPFHGSPDCARIPPWSALPHLVLCRIFSFAAVPRDAATARWLAGVSRTCRPFCEPALSALYASPPLLSMNMAHSLLHQLRQDPSTTMLNYRTKVKALEIEVGSLASRVYKGQHLDIEALVRLCPRLAHLELVHYKDLPPYRQLNESVRWAYSLGLFEAMGVPMSTQPDDEAETMDEAEEVLQTLQVLQAQQAQQEQQTQQEQQEQQEKQGAPDDRGQPADGPQQQTVEEQQGQLVQARGAAANRAKREPVRARLQSWTWNQRFVDWDLFTPRRVQEIHNSWAFGDLKKLTLVNFQRPSLQARNPDSPGIIEEEQEQALAIARVLGALPSLKHLAIESSTSANEYLVPQLPRTLEHLELINCWDVGPALLAEYLVTHGRALRHLTLHHNQSLSLSFLPVLGTACPHLQSLRMNLLYYSQHESYNDSGPLYASLLLPHEVPTWPASLETLELEHLRKCEPAAAEALFQSLVDSAPRLPKLRTLVIKAQLDMPWRQRSVIRDRWEGRMRAVFARRVTDPLPVHSIDQYYAQTRGNKNGATAGPGNKKKTTNNVPTRRSTRLAQEEEANTMLTPSPFSNGSRGRTQQRKRISYREPDTDEDLDLSEQDDDDNDKRTEKGADTEEEKEDDERRPLSSGGEVVSQGMCDLVDIRIDNQKPVEFQYSMGDFLDDEDSDDDDDEWTGDVTEDVEYAW